ncbi:mpv17-like protein [Haliotis cracherodii]|uniref:mpv17-like protein n=1 Tax=Haliotis rufescens TaxID=6454 RepID=UPI00201F6449|nr:mpv17-like protein [Haliotis rufescens]
MVLIFKKSPMLNTMTTYAILWTIADVSEQKFVSKKKKLDVLKTARMTVVGSMVIAPLVVAWIRFAERVFPGTHFRAVIKKVVSEQIMFAPVGNLSFYTATSLLERKDVVTEIKAKFLKTYKTGLMFWPFVQTVNYSAVPHLYKPVFVAGASFMWSLFLCFMKEDPNKVNAQKPKSS